MLVVAPDTTVAAWAAESIDMGLGSPFRALVLGPTAVPWVRPGDVVVPQMAVLSALAHGNAPGGLDTVVAGLAAVLTLDDDHARIYYDALVGSLTEATLRAPEKHMDVAKYEYQSDFARKYCGQGKAEGIASGLLAVLAARGLELPSTLRDQRTRAPSQPHPAARRAPPVAPQAQPVVKKYGINLRGSGQNIKDVFNPELMSAGKIR